MKLVSIVILNWNGIGYTKNCVKAIKKNTKKGQYEIIVVDNGSKGKDVGILNEMKRSGTIEKLILNPENMGFSKANNQGFKVAGGEYLMMLNNDTEPQPGWLDALLKKMESDATIGIAGPNLPPHDNPKLLYGGGYVDDSGIARHNFNADEDVEQVGGAGLVFKRELYKKIGGLDEGFSPIYFEETDFCVRAHRAGYRVVFVPESTIVHYEGSIISKQPSRWLYVTMNKNRLRYMLLHFSKSRLAKAVPWELLRILKSIATLRIHWLVESYIITLNNLGEILEKRRRYSKGDFLIKNQ
jgi:GT2 family glycosyltransferase